MRTSRNPSPPPRTWLHEELKIKDNVPSFEPQVPVAFEEQNSEDDSFLYRPSKYRKSRRPTPPPSPPVSPIGKTVPTHENPENEHESCGQPISIVDDEQPRHTPQKGGKSKTSTFHSHRKFTVFQPLANVQEETAWDCLEAFLRMFLYFLT